MSLPIVYSDKVGQLLTKAERQAKVRRLTELAKKYSHPTIKWVKGVSQSPLRGTFKSGLTPLSPFLLSKSGIRKRRIHNYQKKRFYGFTTAELVKLGVMAAVGSDPYDESFEDFETGEPIGPGYAGELDSPIHPMYQKNQWEARSQMYKCRAAVPVRGDTGGYWVASNDKVWKALDPCLRLASLCLANAELFSWWDALFKGDVKKIDPQRIPAEHAGKKLWSFHERSDTIRNQDSQIDELQFRFKEAAKSITFRFESGYCSTRTGVVDSNTSSYGLTDTQYPPDAGGPRAIISIGTELVQPLLSSDLNYNERMLAQFQVASTILHETAHAIWKLIRDKRPEMETEPYFENEPLSELGWSLEAKMWSGEPVDLNVPGYAAGGPGLPAMGLVKSDWFSDKHAGYNGGRIPLDNLTPPVGVDSYYNIEFFPVPIIWVKDLQKMDKWNYLIKKFGPTATAMGPLTVGTQVQTKNIDFANAITVLEKEGNLSGMYMPPPVVACLTDEQKRAVNTEDARQAKATKIRRANQNLSKILDEYVSQKTAEPVLADVEDSCPCKCPRYQVIKNHFLANRSHNQLAFDTMDFALPEPLLLKYIEDLNTLKVNAAELRAFLHCCNAKKELFSYEPFPGVGMVYNISTGWPPPTPARIGRIGSPEQDDIDTLEKKLKSTKFQSKIHSWFHEMRDVDFELLRRCVNEKLLPSKQIRRVDFSAVITQLAINKPKLVTIGPKGIARLRWKISRADRNKHLPQWLKDRIKTPPPSPAIPPMVVDDIAIVDDLMDEGVLI